VFDSCTFYSLEATKGGALNINFNVTIKNCRFANNTAINGEGNDIYVSMSNSAFFNDNDNVYGSCSLSLKPGAFLDSLGVCFLILFQKC
jgi:hypothetical protein